MRIKWTQSEINFIIENADKMKDEEMAKALSTPFHPISTHSIRKQRQRLNIKKAPGRGRCKIIGGKI